MRRSHVQHIVPRPAHSCHMASQELNSFHVDPPCPSYNMYPADSNTVPLMAAQSQGTHYHHNNYHPCHLSQVMTAPQQQACFDMVLSPMPISMHLGGPYNTLNPVPGATCPLPEHHPIHYELYHEFRLPQHNEHAELTTAHTGMATNTPTSRDPKGTLCRKAPAQDFASKGKHGWTREEDMVIVQNVQKSGQQWAMIADLLPGRSDDAVRNRYFRLLKRKKIERKDEATASAWFVTSNDLRECENINKGDMWTAEEDCIIMDAIMRHGPKWQAISARIPGRSANAIRNRFLRFHGGSKPVSRHATPSHPNTNVDPPN